tara:strand:- start:897 stop:1124 length:228 start_codon:yes stop_codon:yes gene_type:complete
MSKISKEGYQQIQVIRNALDSMYDKLDKIVFVPKGKTPKNVDGSYNSVNVFDDVKSEFETIAGIVNETSNWSEVK